MQSPLAIALFPPTPPFPAVRVSRNKISSCCLLSLSPSLLLALVSRGKHELERNERHSSEKLRFQGATGNLCCFYPRLANRFSRFRVSLVRKANFIDAIEGSGGMGDRNWCARIDRIGDTESRGCVFEFRRDETFHLLERNQEKLSAFHHALFDYDFTKGHPS